MLGFERIETYQKKNGNLYELRTYNDLYRDIIKRTGVDYRNFHTLRHMFATRAYELAFDIPTLAEILDHAQKTTTENIYGHSLDDTKKKIMVKFSRRAV